MPSYVPLFRKGKSFSTVLVCQIDWLFRLKCQPSLRAARPAGLIRLMDGQSDIQVVGEAANGREAIERVRQLKPDVVVMDVSMPEMDGIEATRRIKRVNRQIKILMLTTHDKEELVLRCLDAGVSAHMLRDVPPSQLIIALKTISEVGHYHSPDPPPKIVSPPIPRSLRQAREPVTLGRFAIMCTAIGAPSS